jgi:arylsulfatase A-like enzyme
MRLPLIVRVPGFAQGRTIEDQVAHVDVLPTVLDLLGVRVDLFVQGRSLRPLLAGDSLPERPVGGEAAHTPGLSALRTSRWKYVLDPFEHPALYDLAADPRERVNPCAEDPAPCAPLAPSSRPGGHATPRPGRLRLPPASPAAIDEQTQAKLRALGYTD